ncbi:hypothetical protein ACFVVM_16875 [Nocardia sp. NPDC058176]|uniref:hypothetical protein n=1 Tax=Nocardia sp. NPDC058176 TaxID=3346368 RepID=UPI0036DC36B8
MTGILRHLTQTRIDGYTGEKYCQALADIRSLASRSAEVAIPTASLDQARLEAAILWAVGYGSTSQDVVKEVSQPFGIAAASPRRKGLQLSVGAALGSFLIRVIPRIDSNSIVVGIPGLRVKFTSAGARLTQFGSRAAVMLRGVDALTWREALESRIVDDPESFHRSVLCHDDRLHRVEVEELAEIQNSRTESSDFSDRMMSGLLRRPQVFRGTPVMKFVDLWRDIHEHDSLIQVEWAGHLTHGQVIEKLLDKRFGLPFEMVDHDCYCDDCSAGVYRYTLRDTVFGSVSLCLRRSTLYDDELQPLGHSSDPTGIRSCSLTKFAELGTYRTYTGESMQYAKRGLSIDRDAPVPAVHGAQARLESWLFTALSFGPMWAAHPFAISRVRPTAEGTLMVFLDRSVVGLSEPWDAAETVLECLAPVADSEGGFLTGIPGLRIHSLGGTDLEVTLSGTSARVVFRAASGVSWRRALEAVNEGYDVALQRLTWNDGALTEAEQHCMDTRARVQGHLDWLCSGLLRRIGLLHFGTTSYMFSGWTSGPMLKMELTSARATGSYHDSFIAALTDSTWGLPLTVRKRRCHCTEGGQPSDSCWIELAPEGIATDKNTLQLRFSYDSDDDLNQLVPELRSVGADPGWLQRVLPRTV